MHLEPKSDHASLRSARRWQQQVEVIGIICKLDVASAVYLIEEGTK
jgi:hypothetical protein